MQSVAETFQKRPHSIHQVSVFNSVRPTAYPQFLPPWTDRSLSSYTDKPAKKYQHSTISCFMFDVLILTNIENGVAFVQVNADSVLHFHLDCNRYTLSQKSDFLLFRPDKTQFESCCLWNMEEKASNRKNIFVTYRNLLSKQTYCSSNLYDEFKDFNTPN